MKAAKYIGTCGVCGRSIKVRNGKLVHHGYSRPGTGFIEGDCFAVGAEPYERSLTATTAYRALIQAKLDNEVSFLAKLQAGEVTYFTEIHQSYLVRGKFEVTEYALGVTADYEWRSKMKAKISEVQYKARLLREEVARLDKLVEGWTLKDVKEVG